MSTRRRCPGVWSSPRPIGPNGEKLCFNCDGPLPKGKRYNCSRKCSEEWRFRTSPWHAKWSLRRRDRGVCAICGLDTIRLKQEYREWCGIPKTEAWDLSESILDSQSCKRHWSDRIVWLSQHGIPASRESKTWWDADHVTPVVEGGGECALDNYRTLCIPCHKRETSALAERRALQRRDRRPEGVLDLQESAP